MLAKCLKYSVFGSLHNIRQQKNHLVALIKKNIYQNYKKIINFIIAIITKAVILVNRSKLWIYNGTALSIKKGVFLWKKEF